MPRVTLRLMVRAGGLLWRQTAATVFAAGLLPVQGQEQAATNRVQFARDIAPIIAAKCTTCHQAEKTKGGYRTDTFAGLMSPGRSKESPIVAGQPKQSLLYRLILAKDPDDRMPQDDDPLPPTQIELIREWIEQGANPGNIDPRKALASLLAEAKQPAPPVSYPHAVPVLALAFISSGDEIAAGGYHEVTLWSTTEGRLTRRIQNVAQQVQHIALSPDGRLMAVAAGTPGRLGEVKLFDIAGGRLVRTLATAGDLMTTVDFSPDGKRVAVGGADHAVRVFETATGLERFRSEQNADWIMHLAFSPDGKQIVSASRDKTVRIMDAESGELEQTYAGHEGPVFTAEFSADGKRVISAGRDREIHLWQAADARKLAETGRLSAEVLRLGMSGDRVFASLSDGSIREFRIGEKKLETVRMLGHHGDHAGAVAIHEETGLLATSGHNGEIEIREMEARTVRNRFAAIPGLTNVASGATSR